MAKKIEPVAYKCHRPGSKMARLHQCFDEKGEDKAREFGLKVC
jgi:hypothetical protein